MRIFCSLIALAGYLFAADIKTVHFPSEDRKNHAFEAAQPVGRILGQKGIKGIPCALGG
jgi:hypothetical protein